MLPLFLQEKFIQCHTFQFLFGATASVMILSFVIYCVWIRFNNDFQIVALFGFVQIHINQNAQNITYFVWNFFQQFFSVSDTQDLSSIVFTDKDSTAISIRKTANPFKVFVSPYTFVLCAFCTLCFEILP